MFQDGRRQLLEIGEKAQGDKTVKDAEVKYIAEERKYACWLSCVPGVGNAAANRLYEAIGSFREIYEASERRYGELVPQKAAAALMYAKQSQSAEAVYDRCKRLGIEVVLCKEADFPKRLKEIPDTPYLLFYKGKLPKDSVLSVAVIGARDCSEYGRYIAEGLGRFLGQNGVQVISGMARGIDSISQTAAIEAGGDSFGVLGCGADICYPAQNRALYERLPAQGGILSPYPPGTEPRARLFPPRNRIVSGLADAVVVVEARRKSGTLITVDMALEQGREVYAVPGRVTEKLSEGCNRLLKQGAGVLLNPEDFLEEIKMAFPDKTWKRKDSYEDKKVAETRKTEETTSVSQERLVYDCLDFTPCSRGEILEKLSPCLTQGALAAALMELCMQGKVQQVAGGYFQKTGR